MTPIYLTDEEIKTICHPLRQYAAQVRFLSRLGMHVIRRPDGSPLVWRGNASPEANGRGPKWSKC